MKKIILKIILLILLSNNNVFAGVTLSSNSPIIGTINDNGNLNIQKIVFPNTSGVTVNASNLVNNPNANITVNGNFWIKSVSDINNNAGGWVTFNHGVGTQAYLKNNLDNTFDLIGFAWSKNSGWIYFGDTGVSGGKVTYNRTTGLFTGAGWSQNLGWIPLDGLKLVTTEPKINLNSVFAAKDNVNIIINSLSDNITTSIENHNSLSSTIYTNKNFYHNFQTVKPGNYDYKIQDEFGNINDGKIKIVANTPNLTNTTITNTFNQTRIADGVDYHNIVLNIKDAYGNMVINETGIKNVQVNIMFNNTVSTDQINFDNLGDAINFTSTDFTTLSWIIPNSTASNSSGNYSINISSLAPTKEGYSYISDNNSINISDLNIKVSAEGIYTNVGELANLDIYKSTGTQSNKLIFKPAAELTSINTKNNKIIRDIETIFTGSIIKNTSKNISNFEISHKLDIGANNMMSFQNLILTGTYEIETCNGYNTSSGYVYTTNNCNLNIPNSTSNIILKKSSLDSYITSFLATPKIVNISDPNFSSNYDSIISYTINGINIKYKSFKKTFSDLISNQQIKIAGIYNSGYEVSNTSLNNIVKTSTIKKADFRASILKNITNKLKNTPIPSNIIYSNIDYIISNWPSGKDTIIVEGADLIINGNIYKNNPGVLNSIVVLKDKNGNGGNIWISKNVKFISSIIFADGHLISGDKTNGIYYSDNQDEAIDQLFMKGTIISQNTIGGSSLLEPICPYPIEKINCNSKISKRFDFNHFRHFINGTGGQGQGLVSGEYGKDKLDINIAGYKEAPIIIEYDPLINTNTPNIFILNN